MKKERGGLQLKLAEKDHLEISLNGQKLLVKFIGWHGRKVMMKITGDKGFTVYRSNYSGGENERTGDDAAD